MIMAPRLRKLALTLHVTSSVGWFGAAVTYVALFVAMLNSQDARMIRAAYVVMAFVVRFVIVPFSVASLLTGLVQALGTAWGLFRHWWVVFKLVLTVVASVVLLDYATSMSSFAGAAARPTLSGTDLDALRSPEHLLHAGGGLVVLFTTVVLAVYKPRGMTGYGRRRQQEQRNVGGPSKNRAVERV
jgi:uncharacterized membrane protein